LNGERYRYWIDNKNKQIERGKFKKIKIEHRKTTKKYGEEVTKIKANNLDSKIAYQYI